ncbi:amidase [Leifsonia sp. H3M29-4]|uniref:amidase n=1 Tax=Salinibacterium metalliresistens TaxID=3031321 RepID=UPI0023DBC91F|nr:amidase [Salinibacterium metalliresistens]MDF1479688.1 amidase [Salinibacterium metalliresistens]
MFELHHLSALEQLDWLRRGEVTPLELAEHYLARIQRLDAGLGAFATVTGDAARARAAALADVPRAAALWGLPVAEKDLSMRAGVRTMYGSRLMVDFVPETTDEIVEVMDAAGAVSLGKTNTPEFGMPSYTESRVAPPARTPWDLSRGAGGSSGGAAVAVSAGLLPAAIGSDGGGSIRIPAAATGLVGLKPARGRVPALGGYGQLAGLPTAGPLARTVADAALLLDAIAAPSPWSSTPPSWDGGAFLNAAVRGEGRFQLAVMTSSPWDTAYDIDIALEALEAFELAQRELAAVGHGLEPLALEPDESYAPAFRTIWQAGAATLPAETEAELALLEPLTRWLVLRGRELRAGELVSALRQLAEYERSVIRQFAPFDAVLTPALAMTPRPIGWYDAEDGERNFAQQVQYTPWTSFANVSGLPAIALPVHETADGLPMGVQLIGRPGREDVLLAIGAQLERRLRWQRRHPPAWSL